MEEIKLDVQTRMHKGSRKVKRVLRENFVPGVIYGEDMETTPIKVARRQYESIMRFQKGQAVLFHINLMEGEKKLKDYSAILKEEQHDPVSDELIHVDFHRISLTKEIEVNVPIVAEGDAPGVKKSGGSLEHVLWELDIICLPTNIPKNIKVDVSKLEIGDAIHVKDLALPSGVRTKHEPEAIVLTVAAPMKEEAIEAAAQAAQAAPTEPEVLKEKKPKVEAGAEKPEAKTKEAKAEAKPPEKK